MENTCISQDTEKATVTIEVKVNVHDTVATAGRDREYLVGKARLEALLNAAMKAVGELARLNDKRRQGFALGSYESEQCADISHDLFDISLGVDGLIGDAARLDEPEGQCS